MSDVHPPPPPLPREPEAWLRSELLPFRSSRINLWRSRALILMLATMGMGLFLLLVQVTDAKSFWLFSSSVAIFIVLAIFLGLHAYSGMRKSAFLYAPAALITAVQFELFLPAYFFVFRTLLPGDTDHFTAAAHGTLGIDGALRGFLTYFFGAGAMEETLKAGPALIGLAFALFSLRRGRDPNARRHVLMLSGPLDGMMMGLASGAAFTLLETLGQYVPDAVHTAINGTHNFWQGSFQGFTLLLPRLLGEITGHMAYAAISGYFIGLAVRHPAIWGRLVLSGLVVAATLHTLWDTLLLFSNDQASDVTGALLLAGLLLLSLVTLFVFLSCLLKAKQIYLGEQHAAIDGLSILASALVPPRGAGLSTAMAARLRAFRSGAGSTGRESAAAARVSIGTPADRFIVAANRSIDFSGLLARAGIQAGFAGAICAEAAGASRLALMNTGTQSWMTTTAAGIVSQVPPGSSLPVAAGTRIALGAVVVDVRAI